MEAQFSWVFFGSNSTMPFSSFVNKSDVSTGFGELCNKSLRDVDIFDKRLSDL
jgi:hypothetical protein